MELYEVGGCVRDEILGVSSKDIDFTVVLDDGDIVPYRTKKGTLVTPEPYDAMEGILRDKGFTIYPVKGAKENFTIRGRFPDYRRAHAAVIGNREYSRRDADFVLARIEGPYSDGRRPDWVKPGTLEDDLRRRDFTMNAIAKAPDGSYIDPHNGQADIAARVIRAVGDPMERLVEDALRAVRAVRFAQTKGFSIEKSLAEAMESDEVLDLVVNKISDERIEQEVSKMFRYNTLSAGHILFGHYMLLTEAIFAGRVSLDSTLKTKGRGK